jgi:hypothetical protein
VLFLTLLLWSATVACQDRPRQPADAAGTPTVQILTWEYNQNNILYFNSRLPTNPEISFDIHDNRYKAWSYWYKGHPVIDFNPKFNASETQAEMDLLHEMCHLDNPQDKVHGLSWMNCMHRLADENAMDDIW